MRTVLVYFQHHNEMTTFAAKTRFLRLASPALESLQTETMIVLPVNEQYLRMLVHHDTAVSMYLQGVGLLVEIQRAGVPKNERPDSRH